MRSYLSRSLSDAAAATVTSLLLSSPKPRSLNSEPAHIFGLWGREQQSLLFFQPGRVIFRCRADDSLLTDVKQHPEPGRRLTGSVVNTTAVENWTTFKGPSDGQRERKRKWQEEWGNSILGDAAFLPYFSRQWQQSKWGADTHTSTPKTHRRKSRQHSHNLLFSRF